MGKKFNITGLCLPQEHFIADVSGKLEEIIRMTENGDYFIIDRPRQYGKTTIMYLLAQRLRENKDYLVIDMSFEGIDSPTYLDHGRFIQTFLNLLQQELEFSRHRALASMIEKAPPINDFTQLNKFLRELIIQSGRKVVLMIDEVDKSTNNQLFLDFLGMLRTKYLDKKKGKDHTFHSVILAGVHDIKSLKTRIRPEAEKIYNSPWNIAVDFEVDMALAPAEIASMLKQYATERRASLDIPYFSERLFYLTSGYPFLVSLLCKIIDEKLLPGKKNRRWEEGDLEKAVQIALTGDNTNFDTLIKNLENNSELYDLIFNIIMNGRVYSYNMDNPVIHFGKLYGILDKENSKIKIHNRLYEQRIYNFMASKMETSVKADFENTGLSFIAKDGTLNIENVMKKFQDFLKEQYSKKDLPFLERNGRLLFLAFIKPIINGKGFDFKEVQVSEEKRLDVVITYGNQKYIIELKIWRGEEYHRQGIEQLWDYLDRQHQDKGYLLIYDFKNVPGVHGLVNLRSSNTKEKPY